MPRRTGPDTSDDSSSKEKLKHEPSPKLKVSPPAPEDASLAPSQKAQFTELAIKDPWHDVNITADVADAGLTRHDFLRIYAIRKTFSNVNFTHSNFTNCYFRDCKFIDCNFTGVVFKETNFTHSTFERCVFEYTLWDKTHITPDILDYLPSWENVAYALARSLRVNFAQIGNVEGVNKAATIEVQQNGKMLHDAAFSNKLYYRNKSKGMAQFFDQLKFFNWKVFHYIWGNGESPLNVVVCAALVVMVTAIFDFCINFQTASLWGSLALACGAFWGVSRPGQWSLEIIILLTILRYVLFALFTASLIRRLSRR